MANLENRIRRLKGLSPFKIKEYVMETNGCFSNHGEESILIYPPVEKNAVATENETPRTTMLAEVSAEDIAAVGEVAIEATNGGADYLSEDDDASKSSEDAKVDEGFPNNKDAIELSVAEVSMPLGDEVSSDFGSKCLNSSLGVIGNCIGSVDLKLEHSLVNIPNHTGHFGGKSVLAHQVLDGMSEPNLPISGIDIAGCSGDSMVGKNRIQNREHGDPFAHLEEGPVKEETGRTNVLASAVQAEGSKVPQTVANKLPQSWAKIVANGKGNAAPNDANPKSIFGSPRLNLRCDSKLEYIEPKNPGIIDIDEELIDDQLWDNCAVGYFLDANLAFGLVKATAMTL
ncbi:hypothetical protein U1Q18_036391 [Sarracenia purpurea var. burkii]